MSGKIESAINGICEDSLGVFKVVRAEGDGELYDVYIELKTPIISDFFEFYKKLNIGVKGVGEDYNAFWLENPPNVVSVEVFCQGGFFQGVRKPRELRAIIRQKGKDGQSVKLLKYNPKNENDVKLADIIFGYLSS